MIKCLSKAIGGRARDQGPDVRCQVWMRASAGCRECGHDAKLRCTSIPTVITALIALRAGFLVSGQFCIIDVVHNVRTSLPTRLCSLRLTRKALAAGVATRLRDLPQAQYAVFSAFCARSRVRDAKDVAAGAVLVTAIAAAIIGAIIFWPHVRRLFS